MHITIANKLMPYSHAAGSRALLPGTAFVVEAYPALLRLYRLDKDPMEQIAELALQLPGPMKQFTLQQDLKSGEMRIWGETDYGAIRYALRPSIDNSGVSIAISRHPEAGIIWRCNLPEKSALYSTDLQQQLLTPLDGPVKRGDTLFLALSPNATTLPLPYRLPHCERLSLGCHKAQDWNMILRRNIPEEFLPFWHYSGMLQPAPPSWDELPTWGTSTCLQLCSNAIAEGDGAAALQALKNFFLAGFTSWMIPRFVDTAFHGIPLAAAPELLPKKLSPLTLLAAGARLISNLFVQTAEASITLLPALPNALHCGRLLHVNCNGLGLLDLEWSKRLVRRIVFHSAADQELLFSFPRELKRFRLRRAPDDIGKILSCPAKLYLAKDQCYLLDNCEK